MKLKYNFTDFVEKRLIVQEVGALYFSKIYSSNWNYSRCFKHKRKLGIPDSAGRDVYSAISYASMYLYSE
jgi:hypothetical protein